MPNRQDRDRGSRWVVVAARIAAAVVVVVVPACGGGGGPTTPQRGVFEGRWEGVATLVGVQGQDCVTSLFRPEIGEQESFTMQALETASGAEATVTDESGITCFYEGTLLGNQFDLTATSCSLAAIGGLSCSGGQMRDIVFERSVATGNAAADRLDGRSRDVWSITDSATGEDRGEMVLVVDFTGVRTP